jgi:competence protein ComEC
VTAVPSGRPDLRLVPAAVAVWAGVLVGVIAPAPGLVGVGAAVAAATIAVSRVVGSPPARLAAIVALGCLLGGLLVGAARVAGVRAGPVDELAAMRAEVRVTGVVTDDPQLRAAAGGQAQYVIARPRIERVIRSGVSTAVRSPVLLLATNTEWTRLRPGQRVSAVGRLVPAERTADIAAVLRVRAPPQVDGPPGRVARLTEPLRAGLRQAVDGLEDGPRGLVPALVVGDESLLPERVRSDMRATGLAHLTAVSGTNVTIMLIAVLWLARWTGARSYALPLSGAIAVLGFVLVARTEPSVLRAAAMGLIAVAALAESGRRRGPPALAAGVLVLLLVDPWLAQDAGFALSVLATGAILGLAPRLRDSMPWLPKPLAEAVAVPLAAQVACTPVVVAISAQVSLASVPANILVAPVVAPATILGALAGAVSPLSTTLAGAVGWLAGLPASWIVAVARRGADLPGAVVVWPGGTVGVLAAAAASLGTAALLPVLLRRPLISVVAAGALGVAIVLRPSLSGWPPEDWLVVACDVGQGDAVALRAGPGTAVVVDAGPDPPLVDGCLDELGVEQVPLLILTHFHADHVAGLPGVLDGRGVDQVLVSPLDDPAEYAAEVRSSLAARGIAVSVALPGAIIAVGDDVRIRVIWPKRIITEGSAPNNASIVADATVGGARILLAGDVEPAAQRAILGAERELRADVVKVPHHGSAHQEPELLTGLDARIALVSAGAGNTYGHPARQTLSRLDDGGARVLRTDLDGSIGVVRTENGLGVVTSGPRAPQP